MSKMMNMKKADKAADKACGMEGKKDPPFPKKGKAKEGESYEKQKKAK